MHNGVKVLLNGYYDAQWITDVIYALKGHHRTSTPENGKRNFALNNKTGVFRQGLVGVLKELDTNTAGAEWISIDDFIESQGIKRVNILHADIQGSEVEMLETTVKHRDIIDYFFVSTHHPENHHIPCLRFFEKHGFIILAEHSAYTSCSSDGLIVAKRKGVAGPEKISIRSYCP